METLKDVLGFFFDDVSIRQLAVPRVSMDTAVNMAKIMQDTPGDYIIFDNAGGQAFAIWDGDALVDGLLKEPVGGLTIYAYQLRGKTVIYARPIQVRNHWVEWQFV